jgi:peptide/nickel transport system substrate-binding protein
MVSSSGPDGIIRAHVRAQEDAMPTARIPATAGALMVAALLLGSSPAPAQETPRTGGVLKVATVGEPPTLDIPMSTAVLVYEIMWHVNESLFTYDRNFSPTPLLAESHAVGDSGRRHTIALRRGVRFHNGKEMTAADVVPSLKRWGQVASVGKGFWKNVESIEAKDPTALGVVHLRALGAARRDLSEGIPRRGR